MNEIFSCQTLNVEVGEEGQDKLAKIKIGIIGCGGLGSTVLLYAVRSGFKNIKVFDKDVIKPSNLSRQILFAKGDIDKVKVQVTKEYFKEWVDLDCYEEEITEDNLRLLDDCEIILDCADNMKTSLLLNDYIRTQDNKTLIFCGVRQFMGQMAILDKNSTHLTDIISEKKSEFKGIMTPVVGLFSIMMVNELIKFILLKEKSLLNKMLFLDMKNNILKVMSI